MEVDRQNRDLLIGAIDRYFNEESTAFTFDDEIFEISGASNDATVTNVACILWHYYDDFKDHEVHLDRNSWNYIQRLRLVLASNCVITETNRRIWSKSQLVAAALLTSFAAVFMLFGYGWQLILTAILCGAIALMLRSWRIRILATENEDERHLVPFRTFQELMQVRRSVASFRKEKYRTEIADRRLRGNTAEFVTTATSYVLLIIASPVLVIGSGLLLLGQLWPITVTTRSVVCE